MKRKDHQKRIDGRRIITPEELLGCKIIVPKRGEPTFVNSGGGNGWYVWPDVQSSYVYFR